LLAGQPAALFELGQQIACTVALMPLATSKAERDVLRTSALMEKLEVDLSENFSHGRLLLAGE
jgi:hypothetical protein